MSLTKDLTLHFRNKLTYLIDDHIDTCERVDLATSEVAASMLATLITAAASASRRFGVPREEFLRVCNETFREIEKYEAQRGERGQV